MCEIENVVILYFTYEYFYRISAFPTDGLLRHFLMTKGPDTSTPMIVQTEMTTSQPLIKEGNETICLLAFFRYA